MLLTISAPESSCHTISQDEAGLFRWEIPPCSGSITMSLDNASPCLLTNLSVTAGKAGCCIYTPENGTACAPDLLVMQKNARIRILIPKNCAGHTLVGQVWVIELPEGHPLPEKLISAFHEAAAREEALRHESEALRTVGQALTGAAAFPELQRRPGSDSPEYMHIQELYYKTIRSTSWRITAPLRKMKDRVRLLMGPKK